MNTLPGEIDRDIEIASRAMRSQSWPGEMAEEMEQRANRIDAFLADVRLDDPHGRFISGDAERIVDLERALHDLCDAFQQVYEAEYGPAPAGENGVYHYARRLLGEAP